MSEETAPTGAEATGPYVIKGRGKDKCPKDSFCLFADINYNVGGERESILVIPAKATSNNFSDHGFDQSGDGVSAVVNNTKEENALFNRIDQQGTKLPVSADSSIPDLTKIKLQGSPDGTWNDQAQSALAYKEVVPVPLITEPKPDAQVQNRRQPISGTAAADIDKVELFRGLTLIGTAPVKGAEWMYTPASDWNLGKQDLAALAVRGESRSGRTYLTFYVIQPTPMVKITSPLDGATVDEKCTLEGNAFNATSVDVSENSAELKNVPVVGNKWTYTPETGWTIGTHTVTAKAIREQEKSPEDKVNFTVEKKNLTVEYTFSGSWQDGQTKKWIYSYLITLKAGKTDVKLWRLGFNHLPAGTVLFREFTTNFWGMVIRDGSTGAVLLGTPPPTAGKHIVEKGKSLPLQVQVLYPTQQDAHKKLYGLFAEDWSHKS